MIDAVSIGVIIITITIVFIAFSSASKKHRKEVLFLRPRDKRGETLKVTRETDRSLWCELSDPVHRFIKVGPAFDFIDGKRVVTRFFGIEGSAYTASLGNPVGVKMSVDDFLKNVWGEEVYNKLPQKLRDVVEKGKFGITIEPKEIISEDLPRLTSDDVNDEGDAVILNRLAKMIPTGSLKENIINHLIWFFLGLGFAAILARIGWF